MSIKTIMIIEDSEADHFLAKVTINTFDPNIEILQAFDGQEALDILATLDEQPDLIFLDINMPVMNGHEFLEHYSRDYPNGADVIMLTSSNQEEDRARVESFPPPVKDYLLKPLKQPDFEGVFS